MKRPCGICGQRQEIHAIIAALWLKFIPEMLVDVALLGGADTAPNPPFSVVY
jgi:hypothetical protein